MQSAIDEVIKKLVEHGEALDDARKLAENSLKIAEARNLKDKEAILYATRLVTGNKELSRSFTDVRKTIQETTKLYKDGNSTLDQMNSALEDSRRQIQNTTSSQRRAQLMAEKQELENLVLRANASKQFSESMGKLVGSTGATIANALKTNLQQALASNDGLASGAQLMKSSLDIANSAGQSVADGFSRLGAATAGARGSIGMLGIASSIAGAAIGGLGKTITELGKTGIDFLLAETQSTIAGFKTMSAAGAVYAGGMMEMTKTALDAHMSLDQLSKATSAHRESLSKAGIGMGEGSKRLAKAMYAGGEDMRRGLFALGYSMEEQAGVMADTMAIMAGPSGKLKASNEEVAIQAEAYAKNLKLISTLTGEDAKAKQDKIRQENDTLFMQQYMDSMDEEQRAAFNALQLTMNENDRRALTEKLKYGQIISKDLAIAGSASPALEKKWNEQKALADSGLRDVGQATRAGLEAQAKSFKQSHKETMAQTGLSVANSEGAVSASSVLAKNNSYAGKISSEGIEKAVAAAYEADRAAKAKEKNADGTDKKDKDGNSIYADKTGAPALMEAGQDFLIAKQKLAAENLDLFAVALTTTTGLLTAAMTELRKLTTPGDKAGKSKLGEIFGSDEMKTLGLTIGSVLAGSLAWKGITAAWGAIFSKRGAALAGPAANAGRIAGASRAGNALGGVAAGAEKLGGGLGKGLSNFLAGLASGLKELGSPGVLKGVGTLIGLGAAMWVSAKGLQEFASVSWESMGKGFVTLGGLSLIAKSLSGSTADMIKGAAGIAALGAATWVASWGIKPFQEINWETIGKGAVGIASLATVGAVAGGFAGPMLLGAAGIAALGAATWVAAWGFKPFQELDWSTIGKGLTALGGIGVLGAIAGTAAPLLLLGAAGLGAMGLAAMAIGSGLKLISDGVAAMSDGGPLLTVGKALAKFYEDTPFTKLAFVSGKMSDIGAGLTPLAAGIKMLVGVTSEPLMTLGAALGNFLKVVPAKLLDESAEPVAKFGKAVSVFTKDAGLGFEKFNKELDILSKIDATKLTSVAKAIAELQKNFPKVDEGWWSKVVGGGSVGGSVGGGGGAGSGQAPAQTSSTPPVKVEPTTPATPFKGDQKEFHSKMYETLLKSATKAGVANPEAVARLGAAQSSLETGYGKHTAGSQNYFGIKAKAGDPGSGGVDTQEFVNGKMVTMKQKFRKYNSMEESADDYIKFLQENKRYKGVLAAKTGEEAIAAQGKTGYATDPNYVSKLTAIDAKRDAALASTAKVTTEATAAIAKAQESSKVATDLTKTYAEKSQAEQDEMKMGRGRKGPAAGPTTVDAANKAETDSLANRYGKSVTVDTYAARKNEEIRRQYNATIDRDMGNMGNNTVSGDFGTIIRNGIMSRLSRSVSSMEDTRGQQMGNQNGFFDAAARNGGRMPVQLGGEMGPDGKRGKDPLSSGFGKISEIMSRVADLQELSVTHQASLVGLTDDYGSKATQYYRQVG